MHGALGHLADFQPDTLKTLSLDDLKALLTPEALKSLGLNADFAQELDADAKHALKQLESAFRKKIEVASHHAAMASAADHQHDAAEHVADGEHHHLSVGDALGDAVDFLGGVPFIIPLLGIAAAGGIVYAVAHDDKNSNHAPVANNDSVTTNENAAITFDPRTNDTDSDSNALTVTQVNGSNISVTAPVTITSATGAAIGSVALNTNGTLTFTPARNFFGTPSFTYTISDGNGGTSTATVNLTVTHVNQAPVAIADTFSASENSSVVINVLANDTDPDNDALKVTQVNGTAISTTQAVTLTNATGATIGSVILNSTGAIVFTPVTNYFGTPPSFTYTVSDGSLTATGTVSGTVNQVLVATADTFTTAENNAVVINVLANDTDVAGATLRVTQVNGSTISATQSVAVTGGTVILNTTGNIVFTPTANYSGAPSFTYTATDGTTTSTATVSGNVTFVNQAPTEVLTASRFSDSAGVAVSVPGITVADVDSTSLTTTVSAGHGAFSFGTVTGGATVIGTGTGTIVLTGTAAQINASLAQLKFTGTIGFTGSDTLTVATNDGALTTSATMAITIGQVASGFVQDGYISGATVFFDANGNGVLDPGEAIGVTDATGHYAITSNGPLTGNLIAFGGTNIDTGLANNALLVAPAGSSIINPLTTLVAQVLAANPTFSLQQASNAISTALGLPAGTDYTHYDFLTANDATSLAINKAAVQIVTFINSVVAAGGSAQGAVNAIGTMTSHGGTVDFTSTSIVTNLLVTAGLSSSAAASSATGVVSISQAIASATSTAGVTQTVHDLNQTNVNLPPVVGADKVTTSADHAVAINVLANDKDPEGGSLVIKAVNGIEISAVAFGGQPVAVTGGAVTLGTDGTLTFTPNAGFSGSPSFSYTVADDHGNLTSGLVTVTVSADAGNSAPVVVNDSAVTALHTPVTIDVLANDTDANHDTLTVTQVNGTTLGSTAVAVTGGTVASDGHGHLVFTPDVGTVGNSTFTYTADDGHGATSQASVTVDAEPTSPIYSVAPGDLPAVVAHAADLGAHGVTTIDLSGTGIAAITDGDAQALIAGGLHFAADDHVSLAGSAGHTHLTTTLKGLADLEVSAVAFAGGVTNVSIDAGSSDLGGLSHGALPHFDPALHVTLDIAGGTLSPTLDLGAVATTFAHDGIDAIGVAGNGSLSLNATQAEGFATSGLVFDPAANVTVTATAAELPTLADAHLAGLNIDTIDVSGAATITDAEAANLIQSGIHFAAGDHVTVDATAGHTHLSTTLKGLADLEVSAVAFAGAGAGVGISIDAGTGDLGGLAHSALPTFDPALHVTLDINPGTLDSALDLGAVATTFAHDGIDAIGVLGNGSLDINVAQAEGFATSGLVFDPAATVTVDATAANIGDLADHAASLAGLNIDQINVTGAASITDAEAAALVHAGLHFASGDTVSVVGAAGHTHLSTTLKGLQDLEVSAVAFTGAVSSISIDAGTGDLGSLAHGALPHFDSALHVTLDIDPSQLSSSLDLGSVGAAFHAAGIDSIGVAGGGNLALTVSQAESFSVSGLTFDPATNVTINASAAEATALADSPFALHGLNVDAIHVTAPTAITDVEAVNLIEAGLHFATGDQVALNVGSAGTHLSTSLKGLHDLNVNSIAVATGVSHIELYAGDLHNLQATDIPSFVTAQTNAAVDVTLKVDISEASEVSRLAAALATAGVDHIQFNQPLSSLTADQQAALNQSLTANHLTATFDGTFTGANAVAEVASGATLTAADTALAQSSIYRDLLTSFETSSDTHGHGGVLQLADGATSSLAEAGMLRAYTAETLVVDGRTSGDHLLTTLKDIADIGVDSVKLAAQTSSAPVYIDLGVHAASDIQTLFQNLDLDGHATGTGSIFSGNQAVALVLDADAANALSHTDGALSHLASLGFTEVDVLAAPGTSGSVTTDPSGLQIKVISADDPLYHHLHPATGG